MIQPVLGLLGLTPGYRELDVSMLFLIFFSIFFGILIGDAGYGLVYILLTLLITIWLYKTMKLNTEMKTMVSLFYLLGSCAIIWGVLTGDLFWPGMVAAPRSAAERCQHYGNVLLLFRSVAFIHRPFLAGIPEIPVADRCLLMSVISAYSGPHFSWPGR